MVYAALVPDNLGRQTRSDLPDVDMLLVVELAQAEGLRVTAMLPQLPPKLVEAKLEHLIRRGLLECGVTVLRPWLTGEGRELLDSSGRTGVLLL